MPWPKLRQAWRWVERASKRLAPLRWAFMPVGLCALVAMGVHAAADTVDDRLLALLDAVDAVFDRLFATFTWSEGLVHAVSAKERTFIARGVTLLWELAADVVLAVPALKYAEEGNPRGRERRMVPIDSHLWPALVERVREQPTVLRIARPLAVAAVTLAGACALAKMVQGATYLSVRSVTPDAFAGPLARWVAVACLALLVGSFGWRVFLHSIEHADRLADEHPSEGRHAFTVGWVGTAVTLPLAVAAFFDATPLLSFFR